MAESQKTKLEESAQIIREWKKDPVKFVRDNFGVEPDEWQREVLEAFPSQDPDKMRQSLQACVGPGKSAVMAWCGWNFMACYGDKGQHPKGAAVSITSANLKDNLWAEMSKWRQRSAFLMQYFEWTQSRVFAKQHPETWFISARSWPKTANSDEQGRVLSGLHSEFVLYLIDESGDIPPPVLRAAEQGLSNCLWGKIMQAGNPTSQQGMLYQAATAERDIWHITRITSDPGDPKRSPRVSADWAAEQIRKYGRDNPWVMSSVLGMFPPGGLNTLLGIEEVLESMKRVAPIEDYEYSQKRIGCDVARFGSDATVLFKRQGLMSWPPEEMRGARTNEIAARLMKTRTEFSSEIEFVDGTGGYGAGVIDSYLQAGEVAMEINFSGKAIDPRYFNKRSEMWFEMAAWVKRGGCLPNDPQLAKELSAPTYTYQNGKFRLEEKDQIKDRLGYSPDKADALCLTFALPETPQSVALPGMPNESAKLLSDFDPYSDERMRG